MCSRCAAWAIGIGLVRFSRHLDMVESTHLMMQWSLGFLICVAWCASKSVGLETLKKCVAACISQTCYPLARTNIVQCDTVDPWLYVLQ